MSADDSFVVEELALADVLSLRLNVLRRGTPSTSASYDEDNDLMTRHFGVRASGVVIACSTWAHRPFPPAPAERAMQLKGMAVAQHLQGSGVGRAVLSAGIDYAARAGCAMVWARARNSAMGFYERNGFSIVGDEFVDDATALPHHLVMIRI